MPRMTRLRTSPDTLLPPGEGLKKVATPSQIRQRRQAAELNEFEGSPAQRLKLLEKHLKENKKQR
jgi:hypothetical protein